MFTYHQINTNNIHLVTRHTTGRTPLLFPCVARRGDKQVIRQAYTNTTYSNPLCTSPAAYLTWSPNAAGKTTSPPKNRTTIDGRKKLNYSLSLSLSLSLYFFRSSFVCAWSIKTRTNVKTDWRLDKSGSRI